MMKIESNIFRYRFFFGIFSFIILLVHYFFSEEILWQNIILLSFLSILFPYIIIKNEKKRVHNSIFFSKNGLSIHFKDKPIIQIDWNDLSVTETKFKKIDKSILLKCTSKKNSEKNILMHVNWFTEISILELSKLYVPLNHPLLEIIEKHISSRKRLF